MATAVSDIITHLSDLPPFPKVTMRLLSLLDDPTASVDQLADVISSDPSLVLKVIHISNSPFYMVSRPIQSVREAVFVLGISTIKSITTAMSLQNGLKSLSPREDVFDMDDYWKHSYATAIVANKLAAKRDPYSADRMYLVGLIHDIGKIIHARYWPEAWKAALNHLSVDGGVYEDRETPLFAWPHLEVCVALCRNWQFPENILEPLEELLAARLDTGEKFESTEAPPESDSSTACIINLANSIASAAGFRFPQQEVADEAEQMEEYQDIIQNLATDVDYQLRALDAKPVEQPAAT